MTPDVASRDFTPLSPAEDRRRGRRRCPTATDQDENDEDDSAEEPETRGPVSEGGQIAAVPPDPPFDPATTPLQVRLVDLLPLPPAPESRYLSKKTFLVAVTFRLGIAKKTSAAEWFAR